MDFSLSEEQEMLKKSARNFFSNELPKTLVKEMAEDTKGYPPALWKKMADLGWIGLVMPEEYDGLGGSFMDLAILLEEMGRSCLPGPFFSTVMLGAMTIMEAGSTEQKKKLLPKIASGQLIVTLAVAEPAAVNSPKHLRVKAVADGSGYSISGTKLFVPDAHVADYIICAAKTTGGITLFLVDTKSPGVKRTPLSTMGGDKQCEVNFKGVKVGKGDILGKADKGWEIIERINAKAAVGRCADMLGGAQQVMEMTVQYAKDRVQFGKPIGSFQAVQHHCANIATKVIGSRVLTYQAAWMISQGQPCTRETAIAKAWVNEAYRSVCALGHQVHGAIAWQQDHDMHLFIKRAKLDEVTFGDTTYQEEIVAQHLGL